MYFLTEIEQILCYGIDILLNERKSFNTLINCFKALEGNIEELLRFLCNLFSFFMNKLGISIEFLNGGCYFINGGRGTIL
jgi:hypothetical protein